MQAYKVTVIVEQDGAKDPVTQKVIVFKPDAFKRSKTATPDDQRHYADTGWGHVWFPAPTGGQVGFKLGLAVNPDPARTQRIAGGVTIS